MDQHRTTDLHGCYRHCLVAALVVTAAVVAVSQGSGEIASGVPWLELHYEARKLGMKATAAVRVGPDPVAARQLATVQGGPALLEPRGPMARVEVESHLPFGRDEVTTSLVEVGDGRALQAEKLVTGRKFYWKRKRFNVAGYHLWRAEPADKGEEELDHGAWSSRYGREETFEPAAGDRSVVDNWSLLYALAAADLGRAGARVELVVPSDDVLVVLELVSGGLESKRMSYTESRGGSTVTHDGPTVVRRVRGTGRLLNAEATETEVETGLLGIRGDLELLVLEDGTPMEISGRSKGIGTLVVKLVHRVLP